MKTIYVDELKHLQVEMLVLIDEFCKKNNIRYSLSSGTLIGAVRHSGYIPWDDDIDLMMLRKDYDKFVRTFNGTYQHLSVLAPELNINYYAPYANVFDNRTILYEGENGHRGINIGVKIDIFPIDSVAEDLDTYVSDMLQVQRLNHYMYVKRLNNLNSSNLSLIKLIKRYILKVILLFVPYSYLQSKIKKIALNPLYKESQYVDNVVYNIYSCKYPRFYKSIMDKYSEIEFEGKEFSIIQDYDNVLSKMYGDYMQLPPEDRRTPRHNFEAYWID